MLRMGRSPKNDPTENQPQLNGQPQPFQTTQTQPAPPHNAEPTEARTTATTQERATSGPRAVTESEALARDLREGLVSGFVGGGTTVSGDAEFKGMLRVDGRFTGRIRSEKGSLIVSAGGVVDADIEVAAAKINGTVNGDIVASQRLEFGRSARVRGQIRTPALVVEDGAVFEGSCQMRRPEAESLKPAKQPEARAHVAAAQAKTPPPAKPGHFPTIQTPPPKTEAAKAAASSASEAAG